MAKKKSIRVSPEEAEELMREAYDNSYRLLSGDISYRDLEDECLERGDDLYLIYHIDNGPTYEEVQDMLEWYEEKELYERCGVLKKYMDKRFSSFWKFKKGK